MSKVTIDVKILVTTCAVCGIPFGVPDYFDKTLRETGQSFWCPNGHSLHFGKSDADKLREQLKKTERQAENFKQWYEAEIDDHEHTKKRLSATKGVLTRTKNRIHNGVCPCCNRHFENLERHMSTKHPDYLTEGN